jgi:pimeloyl-ACP methyl ester carboxylesterase
MDSERNPANWVDFMHSSVSPNPTIGEKIGRTLPSGLSMTMHGLPKFAEKSFPVEPIRSDDLLRRAKSSFPIYAFGYNWLESNETAAKNLRNRIEKVISENNVGTFKCTQVILITHSMGGLVARACSQLPEISNKIVGIVHGVMPATGAAVAYRRCKVGMMDEDLKAGLVIGSSGKEVAAVFAQAPGALQLLPSIDYGANWLRVIDVSGKAVLSLPNSDPYEEIYLQKDKWWGLIRVEWLRPENGEPIDWDKFCKNVRLAKEFHRRISKHYHHNTFVFYGGGKEKGSFSNISWIMKKGNRPDDSSLPPSVNEVLGLSEKAIRTSGFNAAYVGGRVVERTTSRSDVSVIELTETSHWEIRCDHHDSAGDGTVPASSGSDPRLSGGRNILQQFELAGIQHEPAYRDYPSAQQVAYYAVTKLAALADVS